MQDVTYQYIQVMKEAVKFIIINVLDSQKKFALIIFHRMQLKNAFIKMELAKPCQEIAMIIIINLFNFTSNKAI